MKLAVYFVCFILFFLVTTGFEDASGGAGGTVIPVSFGEHCGNGVCEEETPFNCLKKT